MDYKLKEYNKKRNFENTLEPESTNIGEYIGTEKPEEHLRFVVQHHLARRDHFDFRLEWNGSLLSWAVPKGPSYNNHDKRLAVQVENHPLEYRNFEGTIPKGEYGGGIVMLWDEGYWVPESNVDEGLRNGSLKFSLKGKRLKGKWALVRLKVKENEKSKDNWLLLKEKDEYAKTVDGISDFSTSIKTGRTMTEINQGAEDKIIKNPISHADVQLAKLVNTAPEGDNWLYELKYDGYRILAYIEDNNAKLITRNGNDLTNRFKDIASSLIDFAVGRAMILDGEMVITDEEGKTDFQALQNYMRNPSDQNLTYIIFDILALDGADLRERHLIDRKNMLDTLMKDAPKNLYYSKYIKGNGNDNFVAACKLNLEGIVGKKADSVYSGTRNGDWIKLKCDKRQEFVIGGYTLSDKKTSGISSILLGFYENENLIYAGRAGTGFTENSMKELEIKFKSIIKKETPFKETQKSKKNEDIIWLEPIMVAEIKFAEWTKENLLRQASFKGIRTDKEPKEIVMEKADIKTMSNEKLEEQSSAKNLKRPKKIKDDIINVNGIKITNPDKVMFEDSEIKKIDIAKYYEKVSKRMLPYVGNRILSIVRCPKGIAGSCFFKKHPSAVNKGVVIMPIMTSSGEREDYFYVENVFGLISEAQMGTLEFHIWGSRIDNLEKPDMMVFDLDPDEGMELKQVRQGVKDIKKILDKLSLKSYLKTSGGKGYHVVVPFIPSVEWNTFRDFAKRIAEVMEKNWPDRYTSNIRKDKRKNKIFIDWVRNGRGATSVAPYSIRARKGANVSMPITWKELDTVAPDGVNMADALTRINGNDPWKDFYKINQRLN
jgi:bifunctional non-homologous end joining protein LigD